MSSVMHVVRVVLEIIGAVAVLAFVGNIWVDWKIGRDEERRRHDGE